MKEEEGTKRVRRWLEGMSNGLGRGLEARSLEGLKIRLVQKGLVRCSLVIRQSLSDKDGNWEVGAMAVLIDVLAFCAVISSDGDAKSSVDFQISFYSTAKIHEEVEVEAAIVGEKGRLRSVVVEVKKKHNGDMLAVGREWIATDNINRYRRLHDPSGTTTITGSKL